MTEFRARHSMEPKQVLTLSSLSVKRANQWQLVGVEAGGKHVETPSSFCSACSEVSPSFSTWGCVLLCLGKVLQRPTGISGRSKITKLGDSPARRKVDFTITSESESRADSSSAFKGTSFAHQFMTLVYFSLPFLKDANERRDLSSVRSTGGPGGDPLKSSKQNLRGYYIFSKS